MGNWFKNKFKKFGNWVEEVGEKVADTLGLTHEMTKQEYKDLMAGIAKEFEDNGVGKLTYTDKELDDFLERHEGAPLGNHVFNFMRTHGMPFGYEGGLSTEDQNAIIEGLEKVIDTVNVSGKEAFHDFGGTLANMYLSTVVGGPIVTNIIQNLTGKTLAESVGFEFTDVDPYKEGVQNPKRDAFLKATGTSAKVVTAIAGFDMATGGKVEDMVDNGLRSAGVDPETLTSSRTSSLGNEGNLDTYDVTPGEEVDPSELHDYKEGPIYQGGGKAGEQAIMIVKTAEGEEIDISDIPNDWKLPSNWSDMEHGDRVLYLYKEKGVKSGITVDNKTVYFDPTMIDFNKSIADQVINDQSNIYRPEAVIDYGDTEGKGTTRTGVSMPGSSGDIIDYRDFLSGLDAFNLANIGNVATGLFAAHTALKSKEDIPPHLLDEEADYLDLPRLDEDASYLEAEKIKDIPELSEREELNIGQLSAAVRSDEDHVLRSLIRGKLGTGKGLTAEELGTLMRERNRSRAGLAELQRADYEKGREEELRLAGMGFEKDLANQRAEMEANRLGLGAAEANLRMGEMEAGMAHDIAKTNVAAQTEADALNVYRETKANEALMGAISNIFGTAAGNQLARANFESAREWQDFMMDMYQGNYTNDSSGVWDDIIADAVGQVDQAVGDVVGSGLSGDTFSEDQDTGGEKRGRGDINELPTIVSGRKEITGKEPVEDIMGFLEEEPVTHKDKISMEIPSETSRERTSTGIIESGTGIIRKDSSLKEALGSLKKAPQLEREKSVDDLVNISVNVPAIGEVEEEEKENTTSSTMKSRNTLVSSLRRKRGEKITRGIG